MRKRSSASFSSETIPGAARTAEMLPPGIYQQSQRAYVRVRTTGDKGFITIKGMSVGATRSEYEYEIPLADAIEMLDRLCERPLIEKTRYRVSNEGLVWEIDEFEGDNRGLIIAEVELKNETQSIELPGWIGQEVTGDPRYFNANLVANPFSQW